MVYPCIHCTKPVHGHHQAIDCDECQEWQHIRCETGLTKYMYFKLKKGLISYPFTCQNCRDIQLVIPRSESTSISMAMDITSEDDDNRSRGDISVRDVDTFVRDGDISSVRDADISVVIDTDISSFRDADISVVTDTDISSVIDTDISSVRDVVRDIDMSAVRDADISAVRHGNTTATFEHSCNVSTSFHDKSTSQEYSLADASLSHSVVADGPTTYEVIPGGTAKVKDMLLYSLGYSYNVRVVRKNTRNWWCSVRTQRLRCPASVIEKKNTFKRGVHDHAHQANPGKKHTVKLTRKVKDEAASNVYHPAKKIVEDQMRTELRDDDFALPDPDLLKRKANRYRQKSRPAEPRGMDFELAAYFIPEVFLRHDITVNGARHIIFATTTQLDILRRAKTWYVDGTFKCLRTKDPFMHLFSIHAFIKKDGDMKQVPLAFAFMSRRRKKNYKKVLKKVKSTFESPPSVERVVMEFKAAVWSALRKVFPLVSLHGCAFHWSQAVFRKVQALGLSGKYKEKGPCHEFVRQVLALPLLPAEHIRPAFSKLRDRATAPLTPLMDYVDATWNSGSWKVEDWSVFGQSIRTNNDCEGWHRRLNYRCVGPPPFYLLVRALHDEARLLPLQVKLISEKKLSKDQRKKSRSIQALVFAVWGRYSAGEISTSRLLKKLAAVYSTSS